MWAITETKRLGYFKNNQSTIQASSYDVVQQALANGAIRASGAMVVPASFTGGQQWYIRAYKNAMALVRRSRKPTFYQNDSRCQLF